MKRDLERLRWTNYQIQDKTNHIILAKFKKKVSKFTLGRKFNSVKKDLNGEVKK